MRTRRLVRTVSLTSTVGESLRRLRLAFFVVFYGDAHFGSLVRVSQTQTVPTEVVAAVVAPVAVVVSWSEPCGPVSVPRVPLFSHGQMD